MQKNTLLAYRVRLCVCLSFRPQNTTRHDTTQYTTRHDTLHDTPFPLGGIFVTFYNAVCLPKYLHQIRVVLKSDKNEHALRTNTYVHLYIIGFYNMSSFPYAVYGEVEELLSIQKQKNVADSALKGTR